MKNYGQLLSPADKKATNAVVFLLNIHLKRNNDFQMLTGLFPSSILSNFLKSEDVEHFEAPASHSCTIAAFKFIAVQVCGNMGELFITEKGISLNLSGLFKGI